VDKIRITERNEPFRLAGMASKPQYQAVGRLKTPPAPIFYYKGHIMFKDDNDEALELKVKNALVDNLSEVRIKFTKKDGTERDMLCTLAESKIPEDKKPKSDTTITDDVLRVFDLEKQDWRSFRWDSIISVSIDTMKGI